MTVSMTPDPHSFPQGLGGSTLHVSKLELSLSPQFGLPLLVLMMVNNNLTHTTTGPMQTSPNGKGNNQMAPQPHWWPCSSPVLLRPYLPTLSHPCSLGPLAIASWSIVFASSIPHH